MPEHGTRTTPAALWTTHRPVAYAIAAGFYWPGAERQDVRQEALIALWEATQQFEEGRGRNFRSFAELFITRRLSSCLKAAKRHKHAPLNDAVRWLRDEDGVMQAAVDELPCLHQVTDLVEDRERLAAVLACIRDDLTPLERHCVLGIAQGRSYEDLGVPNHVDNALWRARRKLKAAA